MLGKSNLALWCLPLAFVFLAFVRAAAGHADAASASSAADAVAAFDLSAERLASVSVDDMYQWDEAYSQLAWTSLTNAIRRAERTARALRNERAEQKEQLRASDAYRRRVRRVERALERFRELNAELDRNLDLDPEVQSKAQEFEDGDELFRRLEIRKSMVGKRLRELAEDGTKGERAVRADGVNLDDREALSRLPLNEIARWDRASCETVKDRLARAMDEVLQARPALRRERASLKQSLRDSDAYERQRRAVERARENHIGLEARLNERLVRDRQMRDIVREHEEAEALWRQLRSMRGQLANRLKHFRVEELRTEISDRQ